MGSFSIWHWLVVGAIVLLLFGGGGKISGLMGDLAKGIKSFKKNMNEDDASMEAEARQAQPGSIPGPAVPPAAAPGAARPTETAGAANHPNRPAA
ncbi:twin-arginine translocase TatA/TatE family subunit [Roseomonas sp. NAR14]|uniref:Sec-independent protein translocase protein TatA n=1 Tax=Roseomonas acroporae TaxID=2937791 RepID=A0A9X2BUQ6_9PROT|nr:twin-arginine translocase TatA/TatE family subunit [Roseomonas acroporae]MCK8783224.1 twin-arginine translocase TatA/TatE family subunit [Roseomonas acroporae]